MRILQRRRLPEGGRAAEIPSSGVTGRWQTSGVSGHPERPALRDFWSDLPREGKWLLSTIIIDFIGNGLVLPFSVVYLHEVRGFSLSDVGVLIAIPAIVGMLVLAPAGHLVDRIGARVVIMGSIIASLLGNLLLAAATTEWVAALALVVEGFGAAVIWPAVQSLVAALMPSKIRQRYFGMSFSLLNLGIGIGGIIGGTFVDVHRPSTFVTIYLVNAVTFLAPLAVYLGPLRHVDTRSARTSHEDGHAGTSYLAILRHPQVWPLFVLTLMSAFVGYAQLNAGAVAFARAAGEVSTRAIGYGFTANTVLIVVLQLGVLQRIENRRRTRVLLVMSAVWALAWVALGLTSLAPGTLTAAVLFAVCCAVFGFGETLLQPTIPAMTNDLATDENRGRFNALMSMAFQVAAIVAPMTAGWLIGGGLSIVYIASLIGGCAVMAWLALVVERRIPPFVNGVSSEPVPASV